MEGWNQTLQSENGDWTLTLRIVKDGKSGAFSIGLFGGELTLIFQFNLHTVLGREVPGLEGTTMHLKIPPNSITIHHNRLVSDWNEINTFIKAELVELYKGGTKSQIEAQTLENIFSEKSNNFSIREIC
jgi:hypothetical protein